MSELVHISRNGSHVSLGGDGLPFRVRLDIISGSRLWGNRVMFRRPISMRLRCLALTLGCLYLSGATAQPYPPSTVITDLTWAPASSVRRLGEGSDGWPMTWGDDGNLYTAFADGNGFTPQVPTKLSLGFGRVSGTPQTASGTNIRSATGEMTGDGRAGKKASGMLMVAGVLYMWVRNANNDGTACQLAWSDDHAQTWTWSAWKFNEFGHCVFLNFGQNYSGARDGYVYMYSPDGSSAYTGADRMILTRVPTGAITERAAYTFFTGLDSAGQPQWSANIAQRGAVFTHEGMALRSGISYNAPLGRYLWWQQLPVNGSDTRSSGGFGIYDAPEPWGPWTTVYYTDDWDIGPGESASLPTKWMSADGTTIYLTFSGNDSLAVRQATLTTTPRAARPNPPTDLAAR